MTPRPDKDGRPSTAEAIFKAHLARHEARMAEALTAHERAVAAAERRRAEAMHAHERAMDAAQRRMSQTLHARDQVMDPMELIRAIKGRRKPPAGPDRRDMEGGEGVPAVPRPKPSPLAGAAAAPIE
jgi:hypothetical protein